MDIKSVWFVSHYSMPPKYEMRVKTLRYAHYLGKKGIDCTIFSASTIHNTDINLIKDGSLYVERWYDDLKFVHIRCCDYKKTDLKRVLNMEQFGYRFAKVAEKYDPPDVIVSDTYCISYKPIYKYCKKHRIPFVVDVRDLWPLSIVEYLGISGTNPVIKMMYRMEKNMYMNADKIIFSMEGGYDYIKEKGLDKYIPESKVSYINNGVDVEEFDKNRTLYQITDPDLEDNSIYKVVYTGSIRRVNNIGILLDTAKKILDRDIKFLVWGDGDEKEALIKRVEDEKIQNVVFKGRVEKKYIPYILSKADLNLIHNNPSKLFKYGISFNKIFDYMAAGKPTLSTFPCGYNPAVMNGAGEAVSSMDAKEIAEAIERIKSKDCTEYCKKAREAAYKFDYKALSDELYKVLYSVEQSRKYNIYPVCCSSGVENENC